MNMKIILGILVIFLLCCGIYGALYHDNTVDTQPTVDLSDLEVQDNLIVENEQNIEKKLYTINESDTNTILVTNNSSLLLQNSIVNKTGDTTDNGDNCDFYGTNSAVLIKKDSMATIENVEINTNSTGSNAVFVTNAEASSTNSFQEGNSMNAGTPPDMPEMNNNGTNPPDMPPGNDMSMPETMQSEGNQSTPQVPQNENNNEFKEMDMQESEEGKNYGNATATIKNVIINTFKDKSRGLDATYGGTINADNVQINTRGGSCAALATDRGEGTLVVNNSELNTGVDDGTGRGSPCIYSTGNISVSNSKGTAYVSQIACIEGKNSITLTGCDLVGFGGGNREDNGEYVDLGGIFIYQSMSGDADVGTSTFNATDSTLSIDENSDYYSTAPMFHITNTKSIINLESCDLNFGSGILVNVSGQNQWGNVGSNGGYLEFNCIEENVNGNIFIDEISSLIFNLKNSEFTGAINSDNSYGTTNVIIESDSTWTLTGDSHVSSLENNGKIDYSNYTLYVDGEAYTSSNPYN